MIATICSSVKRFLWIGSRSGHPRPPKSRGPGGMHRIGAIALIAQVQVFATSKYIAEQFGARNIMTQHEEHHSRAYPFLELERCLPRHFRLIVKFVLT